MRLASLATATKIVHSSLRLTQVGSIAILQSSVWRLQVLVRVLRRKWRWRSQAIDQLLHAPEDVSPEALQQLTKCAGSSQMPFAAIAV